MADMEVKVRLTGEGGQLVGQLNNVAQAEANVAQQARQVTASSTEAAAATTRLGAAGAATARNMQQARQAQGSFATGSQGLALQFGDFVQQLSLGTPLFTAFGQQAGQAGLAMTGMGGRMAVVGRFLIGPWGAAVLAATTVLGGLGLKFLQTATAADTAKLATDSFASAQSAVRAALEGTNGRLTEQNALLLANARLQAINLRSEALQNRRTFNEALGSAGRPDIANRARTILTVVGGALGGGAPGAGGSTARARVTPQSAEAAQRLLRAVRAGTITPEAAIRQSETINLDGLSIDRTAFQDAIIAIASSREQDAIAREIDNALNTRNPGRFASPGRRTRTPSPRTDRSAERLAEYGQRTDERIRRITEQFDEQPSLIDRSAQALRELDQIVADLNKRAPNGFEAMVDAAQRARAVVEASLAGPFNELIAAGERQAQVQELLLAGLDDEAKALQQIFQLQERVGFVTQDQREAILANVRAERQINEELQQRQELLGAYQSAIGDVRSELEGLLGGFGNGDIFKNLRRTFQQLQGRILTEQIFGPALRELDAYVRERTGIQSSVDIMRAGTEQAGRAALGLADTFQDAMAAIRGEISGDAASSAGLTGPGILTPEFAAMVAGLQDAPPSEAEQQQADDTGDIVVTLQRISRGAIALTPAEFFGHMSRELVGPMLDDLDRIFGTEFFGRLSGVLSGALEGYATAGPVGAILGGLKEITGLPAGVQQALGKAFSGAQTGYQIANIGKALGLKTSSTGGSIGGAIGSLIPIPGGEIIGSIIGSVVGGLFKKTPKGNVTITGTGSSYSGSGKLREGLTGAGGAVSDTLRGIADQLGGDVGTFSGAIRQKGKKVYANGVRVDDLEAAAQKVIADALASGAITGLSAAVSKALASSTDTQKAVNEALKVKELEKLLGGFVGSARDAFQNFERQAADRLRIATAYGLEITKVEQLNAKERIKLREQLERESFGSLQDLLDRMRSGDLFEGSAVDRRTALLAEIQTARDAAARGDEGASDKLAQLLEQLNSVSRDVYGTTGGFATDRSSIESTASDVIQLLRAQLDSADPNATNALLDENNEQNAQIIAELRRLGAVLGGGAATGTETTPKTPGFDLGNLAYTGGSGAGISGGAGLYGFNLNLF